MFNALNHPNLDNLRDASSGSASYRSTLFGQTCCATAAPSSTQSIVDTGESARVIQFCVEAAVLRADAINFTFCRMWGGRRLKPPHRLMQFPNRSENVKLFSPALRFQPHAEPIDGGPSRE